jgi:hypothetical protein
MKIRIWKAVTDNGDGSNSSHIFKSKQEMIEVLELFEVDGNMQGSAIDSDDYTVEWASEIFDTKGFEVIE